MSWRENTSSYGYEGRKCYNAQGGVEMRVRMHPTSDPLLEQPQAVTLLLPVMQTTLVRAGIEASRDEIIDRFMGGAPRVAVVYGSEDHPAHLGMEEVLTSAYAAVWEAEAIPFGLAQSAICDGVAQGHVGMSYSLASRNLTTALLVSQLEGHGYDAALILDGCDKRPPGNLAAVFEVDRVRQASGRRPFYATFIPAPVMPEVALPKEELARFAPLKAKLPPPRRQEMDELLRVPLKSNIYPMLKKFADQLLDEGLFTPEERDDLVRTAAKFACVSGGVCAFIGTGNTNRMVMAALGLVYPGLELLTAPPTRKQVEAVVNNLLALRREGDPAKSATGLGRANLKNAATVWSAVGGSTNWLLHFPYLAAALGEELTPTQLSSLSACTPQVLHIDDLGGKSIYTLALEMQRGENSGLATIMRALAEGGHVDLTAPTVKGTWSERVAAAVPPNGGQIFSARRPLRPTSGVRELKGNLGRCVIKMAGLRPEQEEVFDDKVYLALFYLGEYEAQRDLLSGWRVLEKLERAVTRDDLLGTYELNFPEAEEDLRVARRMSKAELFRYLVDTRRLRVMLIIAGEGPKAHGMPEMYYPSEYLNRDPVLKSTCALLTDGRYSGCTYGPSLGHLWPEALDHGPLAGVRTGDWIHLQLRQGRINVLSRGKPGEGWPRPLRRTELRQRPEMAQRVAELRRRQATLAPSVRALLQHTTGPQAGVGPKE